MAQKIVIASRWEKAPDMDGGVRIDENGTPTPDGPFVLLELQQDGVIPLDLLDDLGRVRAYRPHVGVQEGGDVRPLDDLWLIETQNQYD